MAPDTRGRMIDAAVQALRAHGVAGMSFTDVLKDSGAARGAIYHHFPGGKTQLVAEAAECNGREVAGYLAELSGQNPDEVVTAFATLVRPVVEQAAQGSGCAVAAVAVGTEDPELRRIAAGAFEGWIDVLAARLADAGLAADPARGLATTLVTLLEGTQVLCRAAGNVEPFEQTVRTMRALVALAS